MNNEPIVGHFASQLLVSDTTVYEIIAKTEKTLTLRHCRRSDDGPASEWPIIRSWAVPNPMGDVVKVRLRKDGTYRTFEGAFPIHFSEVGVFTTDYSF